MIDSLDISGGAENQLVANLMHFDRDKFEHEIAVVKEKAHTHTEDVRDLAVVHSLRPAVGAMPRLAIVRSLRRLIAWREPHLVHASLPDSALATRIVARVDGTLAVESLVNISHEPVRTIDNPNVTTAKLRFHSVLDRLTMRSLAGYHAVSQAVADSWTQVVGLDASKVEVIPRGVDPTNLGVSTEERLASRASVLEEFNLPEETLLVISVGRVEPQKGHRYLVEAMAQIENRHPHARVLIVGRPGTASESVENLIGRLGLSEKITLPGARRDLRRLLGAADLFAFPSLFEGNGGNAMIEAMAAGLPIVTTDQPPMTDLIPSNGFGILVGRCDSHGLAAAIDRLAGDPLLRESLGNSAKRRASTFAGPAEIANRHEDWYRRVLAERAAVRG